MADSTGPPPLIDIHVHYFPRPLFEAVWRVFEGPEGYWPIRYKLHGQAFVDTLRAEGVRHFTTLVYAHRPGLADDLNEFVAEAAQAHPEMLPWGTVFAGDEDVLATARRCLEEYDFRGLKLHPVVSKEMMDDPRLFPVYELMESEGKILLVHAGSGPQGWMFDGPERATRVMRQFPNLKLIIAHCGAAEYDGFSALAQEFPSVYFDTAMVSVGVPGFTENCPGTEFYRRHADRILYGSDFPNIPYAYADQADAIRALNLGAEIEARIFHDNAAELLGIT